MKHLRAHPLALLVLPLLLCPAAALAGMEAEIGISGLFLMALYVLVPAAVAILGIGCVIWGIIASLTSDKAPSDKTPPDKDQNDLRHVADDNPDNYGHCPNCDHRILLKAVSCEKCGAIFGSGSAWCVKDSQESRSAKLAPREN